MIEKRPLGHTGIDVTSICLGTMTWGEQNTEAEAHQQLSYACNERGVNFIDAAELYPVPPKAETQGRTEEYIGTWLQQRSRRDDLILATKACGPGEWVNYFRGGPRHTKAHLDEAIDASLARLQTDYVDLYQLHWPDRPLNVFSGLEYRHKEIDDVIPILETLDCLTSFVKDGKIRSFGISNETAWGTCEFVKTAEMKNLEKVVSIQNPYNLLNRSFEVGLSEVSIRENVGLLAYSPLASGTLSGKYLDGKLPEGSRLKLFGDRYPRYRTENAEPAIKEYVKISKKANLDICQMAIKFCEIQPFVTSVIIGATNINQLKKNLESHKIKLDAETITAINEIQLKYSNPCP